MLLTGSRLALIYRGSARHAQFAAQIPQPDRLETVVMHEVVTGAVHYTAGATLEPP